MEEKRTGGGKEFIFSAFMGCHIYDFRTIYNFYFAKLQNNRYDNNNPFILYIGFLCLNALCGDIYLQH